MKTDVIFNSPAPIIPRPVWCYVWPGPGNYINSFGGLVLDVGKKERIRGHKYWKTKKRREDCERRNLPFTQPLYVIVVKPKKKFGAPDK